ncbi:DUF1700 domain-containing protein [Acetobacter oeni]|uniref:Membrane protein n=1 Tax=Acetobacter oeni TaxID=304077 RepID=A0A511XLS2_9PROT|nr:DUF1700 domain-containing protein [Acetobacter oeni]MBB3881835.1 putative membrane protein [Acetobacter oeni]NHO17838.1 DUF1700 domain-containing protein [Acetobacter oeni]GBR07591.1 hypothetical protein AA21952_2380 [Acetobacter oeni LMG 21952]GEN63878.1 membrane protein [Acetobacter oeni]
MNEKEDFMRRLATGLRGMPADTVSDILQDYEGHFDEGRKAGRSDADIARHLGDPARLARELRAEAGIRRWEDERSMAAALGAILGLLGLVALDVLIVAPVLIIVLVIVFCLALIALCTDLIGLIGLPLALLNILPLSDGTWLQNVLLSLGTLGAGISGSAFCALFLIGLTNLISRYARAHFRLISPGSPLSGGVSS